MYVINVIPTISLPRNQAQILSYFYIKNLKAGTLVEIPLRNKKIKGIVLESKSLLSQKLSLKKISNFETKSISQVLSKKPILNKNQINIALWISSYYYAPLGLSLKAVLPPFWEIKKYPFHAIESKKKDKGLSLKNDIDYLATENFKNHHKEYAPLIKGNYKKGQILLLVPDKIMADYFMENYKEFNPIQLHSEVSNKEYYELWQKVQSGKPIFIIGTRSSLFLPFQKLNLIIVDDEPNTIYKSDMTPKYNAPTVAKKIAGLYGSKLIINALIPTIETYNGSKSNWLKYGSKFNINVSDMVSEIKSGNFSIFGKRTTDAILTSAAKKENSILFVPRRGYSPALICKKCGATVTCSKCKVSMVIHKGKEEKKLICHHCQSRQEIPKLCPNCKSYKLKSYGIGVEKVIDGLNGFFEKKGINPPHIFRLDSDVIKNNKEKKEIFKKFQESKGGILVTTQMIFSFKYLINSRFIGIMSTDSLAGFIDFRTEERLFRTLSMLGYMAENIHIQTYNPEDISIQALIKKSGKDFFNNELSLRKELNYPPFSQLIKLAYNNKSPRKAKYEAVVLTEKLKQDIKYKKLEETFEILGPTREAIEKIRGRYAWTIILKIKGPSFIETLENTIKTRNELLRIVPSRDWRVEVDPVNVL